MTSAMSQTEDIYCNWFELNLTKFLWWQPVWGYKEPNSSSEDSKDIYMGMLSEALILSSAIACVQSYLSPFLEPALMYMVAMALMCWI